ncbi:MAG: hypothetical protein QHI48_00525 [Bacteroidota bacterium]|nr:hypothetical protein [Bacteroidota bacterium]
MKHALIPTLLAAFFACTVSSSAQTGRQYIINHFVSDPGVIEAHLVITDVDGLGPTVTIKCYNNDGKLIGEGKETIPPFGKVNLNPGKYVNNSVVNGTVHISATSNIVAEYWQFYKKTNESWKNTTAVGAPAPGYERLVCPHFVSDKNVEAYLVLADSDGKGAVLDIVFYNDGGAEVGRLTQTVKPNGKVILKPTDHVKAPATGVVHITAAGGRVTGEYWQAEDQKRYQTVVPMGGI